MRRMFSRGSFRAVKDETVKFNQPGLITQEPGNISRSQLPCEVSVIVVQIETTRGRLARYRTRVLAGSGAR
jgi:hypothetical protein